jgi:hypothetical protein
MSLVAPMFAGLVRRAVATKPQVRSSFGVCGMFDGVVLFWWSRLCPLRDDRRTFHPLGCPNHWQRCICGVGLNGNHLFICFSLYIAFGEVSLTQARLFHASPVARSLMISGHRDSAHNNKDTPFEFTPENQKKVQEILSKYPTNYKASATIPLLDLAQRQNNNWVPLAAMNKIAEIVEVAPIRVYEVLTTTRLFVYRGSR